MILGINFKSENLEKDTYKITEITELSDSDTKYSPTTIDQIMKNHDMCIIVPDRNSYKYKIYDIDTFNHIVYDIRNKFVSYSKANHIPVYYNNFIFMSGYSHGKTISSQYVEEKIKELKTWFKT